MDDGMFSHSGPKGSVALWLQATSLHRRADLFTVSFMAFQLKTTVQWYIADFTLAPHCVNGLVSEPPSS